MKEVIAKLLSKEVRIPQKKIINLIEIPPDSDFGDFSFPCFLIAKEKGANPREMADKIAEHIKTPVEISQVQSMNGYVNFFVNKTIFAEKKLQEILKLKKKAGKEKILIEHTSINPNASPHVGRIRNSIIGDSLKRILEFQGYKLETHYYVNDVSKQIAMMTLNCTGKEKFSQLLGKYKQIANKVSKDKKIEKKVFEVLNKFEAGDKTIVNKFKRIVDTAVAGQKKILSDFGINFDFFDYESKFMEQQKNILSDLKKTGKLFTDKEGRKVLDQKGMGLEKSMKCPVLVLTRNDGTGLYPLRDIAYTTEKSKKAKRNIIVLGEDQKLYFRQLASALKILNKKAPEAVHYSFVLIQKKEGKVKMSTRKGDVVLFEDFFREVHDKAKKEIKKRKTKGDPKKVAIGAIKYNIIRNSPNRNIVFNIEEALNFEGNTGPYLQYSYARASSIIKKAKKKVGKIKIESLTKLELAFVKKLALFQKVVDSAEQNLNPSLIANYSFELAKIFNEFYHACPVIKSMESEKAFRIMLVEAFRKIMKDSLNLLGIEAMEEM